MPRGRYRDYEKASGALKEALKYLKKEVPTQPPVEQGRLDDITARIKCAPQRRGPDSPMQSSGRRGRHQCSTPAFLKVRLQQRSTGILAEDSSSYYGSQKAGPRVCTCP